MNFTAAAMDDALRVQLHVGPWSPIKS